MLAGSELRDISAFLDAIGNLKFWLRGRATSGTLQLWSGAA